MHDERERWLRVELSAVPSELVAVFNFADEVRTIPLLQAGHVILSTDDPKYGGRGDIRLSPSEIALPPFGGGLLRAIPR